MWCRPGMSHRYDFHSGWCTNCGRQREDGRTLNSGGDQLTPGPEYTLDELDQIRKRLPR